MRRLMDAMAGEARMILSTDLSQWAPAAFKRLKISLMSTPVVILLLKPTDLTKKSMQMT